jgi:hypothetical protein
MIMMDIVKQLRYWQEDELEAGRKLALDDAACFIEQVRPLVMTRADGETFSVNPDGTYTLDAQRKEMPTTARRYTYEQARDACCPADRITQVSGFGIANTIDTQSNYAVVALTEAGRVLISMGGREWEDLVYKTDSPINK